MSTRNIPSVTLEFLSLSQTLIESQNRLSIIHGGTIASMVDLGGSLAVASRGLYATGVSTDLNGELPWDWDVDSIIY